MVGKKNCDPQTKPSIMVEPIPEDVVDAMEETIEAVGEVTGWWILSIS